MIRHHVRTVGVATCLLAASVGATGCRPDSHSTPQAPGPAAPANGPSPTLAPPVPADSAHQPPPPVQAGPVESK